MQGGRLAKARVRTFAGACYVGCIALSGCLLPRVSLTPDAGSDPGAASHSPQPQEMVNRPGDTAQLPNGGQNSDSKPPPLGSQGGTSGTGSTLAPAAGGTMGLQNAPTLPMAGAGTSGAAATVTPSTAGAGATAGLRSVSPPAVTAMAPTAHTFAEWPMPDAAESSRNRPSYSTSGEIVTDNVTHLTWQRKVPPHYDGCIAGDGCSWEEAKSYCASDALAKILGPGEWRLPTKIEMESIFDETRGEPAIDTEAFPSDPKAGFWTATPRSDMVDIYAAILVIGFTGVVVPSQTTTSGPLQVRCVSSPMDVRAANKQYDVTANTVRDLKTGLTWERLAQDTQYSWDEANSHCRSLGAGWRMPNLKELWTVVDPTRSQPSIDPEAFPNAPTGYYWTASPYVPRPAFEWIVNFYGGIAEPSDKASTNMLRCVQ